MTAFVFLLLVPAVPGITETVDGAGAIGEYQRMGEEDPLSPEHVEDHYQGKVVEGPPLTDQLAIDTDWANSTLGPWASDSAFEVTKNRALFQAPTVHLKPFQLNQTPQFSMGSADSIIFQHRPMWVSFNITPEGAAVVTMDDGNPEGQEVKISRNWLRAHDLEPAVITHENGELLSTTNSTDFITFTMPHFSFVTVSSGAFDVRGKQGAIWTSPYIPLPKWDSSTKRLEIDVTDHWSAYEIWIEREWIDAKMPHVGLRSHDWTVEWHDNKWFYVVSLLASETPTTLVFEEFYPTAEPTFTLGNSDSIYLWAANDSVRKAYQPIVVAYDNQNLSVESNQINRLLVNKSWLASEGIGSAHFRGSTSDPLQFESYDSKHWIVETIGSTTVEVKANYSGPVLHEEKIQIAHLQMEAGDVVVRDMGYAPWLNHGFQVVLNNLSWDMDYWGNGNITQVNLTADGLTIATASPVPEPVYNGTAAPEFVPRVVFDIPPTPTVTSDTVFGIVFSDGANSFPGEVGMLVSTDLETAGVFQQIGDNCAETQSYGSVVNFQHRELNWRTHRDDHTHPEAQAFQNTAFIAQPDGWTSFAWRPIVDVSTCPGFSNPRTVTVTTYAGFRQEGNTRWLQNAQQDLGVGITFAGADPAYAEYAYQEYYDPGSVSAAKPYMHTDHIPDYTYNGADDGRKASLNCHKDWEAHLGYLALTTLVSLLGAEGTIASVVLGAAATPAKSCEIQDIGSRESRAGTTTALGGGPWFDNEARTPGSIGSVYQLAAEADWNPTLEVVLQGDIAVETQGGLILDVDMSACAQCQPATVPPWTVYWTQTGGARSTITMGDAS